jgi:hypothetical protein
MPAGAVYVGRPSRWGNDWKVGVPYPDSYYPLPLTREAAIRSYRQWLERGSPGWLAGLLEPLRDATALACWCPLDQPCHADVLIELLA